MSDRPQIALPKEKWADEVRVHSRDQAEIDRIAAILEPGIPDFHDIGDVELDKTAEEIALIDESLLALNCFRIKLGLEPIGLARQRFHFLTDADWDQRVEPTLPGSGNMAMYGHCYLRRRPRQRLALNLTHELCHAASYLSIDVVPGVGRGGKPKLALRRCGLACFQACHDRVDFDGLNEAATELAALNLRHVLSLTSRTLTPEERAGLADSAIYYPHVRLLIDLLAVAAPAFGGQAQEPIETLYRDYFLGSFDFLRRLSRLIRGSARVLREMSTDDWAPVAAAERLGLAETAADLKRLLEQGRLAGPGGNHD